MPKFDVEITEYLQRTITVDATDEKEAYLKVKNMYKKSEIILDDNDYIDTDIEIVKS